LFPSTNRRTQHTRSLVRPHRSTCFQARTRCACKNCSPSCGRNGACNLTHTNEHPGTDTQISCQHGGGEAPTKACYSSSKYETTLASRGTIAASGVHRTHMLRPLVLKDPVPRCLLGASGAVVGLASWH